MECLVAFTFVFASKLFHCVSSACGIWLFSWTYHPLQPILSYTNTHTYCIYTYIHVNPIRCLYMSDCLSLYGKVAVPLFLFKVFWNDPNSVFPVPCFHRVFWAITVIAIIIGIILTLVPLCSRKGLTLSSIYADWLDRPGIPKVWGIFPSLFFLSFIFLKFTKI